MMGGGENIRIAKQRRSKRQKGYTTGCHGGPFTACGGLSVWPSFVHLINSVQIDYRKALWKSPGMRFKDEPNR